MRALHGLAIFLYRFHRLSLRRPGWILACTAILLGASIAGFGKTRTLFAIHDIEDPALKVSQAFKEMRQEFPSGSSFFIIFQPSRPAGFTTEELFKIRKWIAEEKARNEALLQVNSPFEVRSVLSAKDKVWYPPLLRENQSLSLLHSTPWRWIFTDESARDLAVEFLFRQTENSRFYGSLDPHPVGELLDSLKKNFGGSIKYYSSGDAVFQYYAHEGIMRNHGLNMYLLILLLIAFRLLFGTWKSGLSFALTLGIMAAVTFGMMGWFGIPIDLISSGLFLMLAVAALEDFLFLCHEQLQRQTRWRKTFRAMLIPSFFTSLTTILGFGSLYATDLLIMRRFGIWAAVGCLVEWLAVFIVLPALIAYFPALKNLTNVRRSFFPNLFENLLRKNLPVYGAGFLLLPFALGAAALLHLNISGAPKDMLRPSHPFIQGLDELKNSRGWEAAVQLAFASDASPEARQEILAELERQPNVRLILSPEKVENHFTKNLGEQRRQLVLRDLHSSPDFQFFYSSTNRSRAFVYVKDTDTKPMTDLLQFIEERCRNRCEAGGEAAAHAEFSSFVPAAFINSFGTSLVLLILALVFLVRTVTAYPRPYAAVILSSLWGPFVVLAIFGLWQVKINFMACLFLSVLVGLAGDNAIQFIFASRKKSMHAGLDRRGGASLMISLFIALSCLIFLGSYFVSPRVYGLFLALGILVSTMGDIWFLRILLGKTAKPSVLSAPACTSPEKKPNT